MKKTLFTVVLILAMAMVIGLASCSKTESKASEPEVQPAAQPVAQPVPQPEPVKELTIDEKLIADQWCFGYSAEGYGDFTYFFHFYEEDPTLGKVYYAGMSNNRQNFAGKYRLVEREYAYAVYKDRETSVAKGEMIEGTVPFTVVLYDWDGNITGSLGFDGEKLVNAQDKNTAIIYSTGSTPYFYEKNTGKFDSAVAGEIPQPVYSFVADDDVTSTIQINHNHTYTDLVAAMIEGTWKASAQADGAISFALTPNDKTDTPATLVVSADRKTAAYTPEGDSSIAMSVPKPTVTLEHKFAGKVPTSYGKDADVVLEAYSDGSFIITASIFGNSMDLDKGTWTVNAAHKFTFVCEIAGTVESEIVGRSVQFTYVQNGTKLGDINCVMTHE